jgi:hypothetical protein
MSAPFDLIRRLAERWASATEPPPVQPSADAAPSEPEAESAHSEDARLQRLSIDG